MFFLRLYNLLVVGLGLEIGFLIYFEVFLLYYFFLSFFKFGLLGLRVIFIIFFFNV